MSQELEIREGKQVDAEMESLYLAAFPDENLLPLVKDLLSDSVVTLSLLGTIETLLVGHVIFTKCAVTGSSINAALLAPLAVLPAWQRQGIGSAIVEAGLRRLNDAGVDRVFVLGDPAYYGRFGFRSESLVEPPYPFPADLPPEWDGAWQSKGLGETSAPFAGKLSVPLPWKKPALWSP